MTKPRPYQIRLFLREDFAAAAARQETPQGLKPLFDVLARHHAALSHTQLEEFESFVKIVEEHPEIANKGTTKKLYALTKASLATPEKRREFAREFTVSIEGRLMFTGRQADALIADLRALGDGPILTSGTVFRPGQAKKATPVHKTYLPRRHPGT